MKVKDRMVWIELVTDGDDPEKDTIESIHTIVTDKDLEIVAEAPSMDATDVDAAQQTMIALISEHVGKGTGLLAGSRVRDVRRFLANQMPELSAYLHYRTIDVSTVRELVRRWYPDAHEPGGEGIRSAIEELRRYRASVFAEADTGAPTETASTDAS